jgi:hypothetical protein
MEEGGAATVPQAELTPPAGSVMVVSAGSSHSAALTGVLTVVVTVAASESGRRTGSLTWR